ncbi:MAG: FtsW/RodA/SpoVE family cell cycle protein [Clostridiaceae bacterium]|nr:FtsW/RodA/SpoVE family cell cycle protein [Clostridiaceae bacterium]HZJ90513.1 FtsW/RodA/SpoVE family cell cycle protein [Oscillospiraceae bacterium]
MHKNTNNKISRVDRFFRLLDYRMLVPVAVLVIIGLVVLNTVLKSGYGAVIFDYPNNYYKQVALVLIGLLAAFIICLFEKPTLSLIGALIYGLSIILLIYIKIDGYRPVAGADSWLYVPLVGSFQPSELAKIGVALVTGPVFGQIKEGSVSATKGFAKIAVLYAIPFLLVITEVDLGTSMVILFMFLSTIFVWGIKWRYIFASLAGITVVAVPLLWQFFLSGDQKNRILTFFFRGHDQAASYQINQSIAAVASGGIAGNTSGQYVNVPVKESDFIFPAISEQLGLIGSALVIIVAAYFIIYTLKRASQIEKQSYASAYVMVALIASIAFHYIENIGMTIGLLPITGIPLPFISYGGSSMIANFVLLGVLLNISMDFKLSTLN